MTIILKNLKDTEKFAGEIIRGLIGETPNRWNKFAKKMPEATLINLSGHLGAGKTTLVKEIAKQFGVKEHITSPTFVIIKSYKLKAKRYKLIYHIDAYRLKSGKELLSIGFKDLLKEKDNLIFLEWPENVESAIPKKSATIYLKALDDNQREIKIKLT